MSTNQRVATVSKDPELLALLGQLSISWASVDWSLRYCLKRIEGVSWESDRGKKIQTLRSHQCVIDEIKKRLATQSAFPNSSTILSHVAKVGSNRHELLYGRRNALLHAMFLAAEDGEIFPVRPGGGPVLIHDEPRKTAQELIADLEAWRSELIALLGPPPVPPTNAIQFG